jgi:hypothetical protein
MNNRYGDNGYREDRQRGRFGQSQDYGRGQDDRGFFDRAGDEVRSWFGDEEAERRREADERRWERERGISGRRDNQSGDATAGYGGTGSGWGNQEGNSWNRDRPGAGGSYGAYGGSDYGRERDYGSTRSDERYGDFRAARGGEAQEVFGEPVQGGASGFGGYPDHGRRFDRIDPGHVGTQGAHPMSSPVGGAYGGSYGIGATGAAGSSARYAQAQRSISSAYGGDLHDPHYSEWRSRQIESLDRDYDEYRREHQSKFEQDFGNWRSRRGEQRQSMSKVTEHMEVIGSDGEKIGTVDGVRGDRIILAKNDENASGHHHSIPCSWIDSVDDKVKVNKSRDEAMNAWRDEERSRALFEREDSGSRGPHVLNRSFSGTY